jgi:hypothetical protein
MIKAFKHNEHPTPDEIRTPTMYIFDSLASQEPMIVTRATKSLPVRGLSGNCRWLFIPSRYISMM